MENSRKPRFLNIIGRLAVAGFVLAGLACSPADSSKRVILITFDSVRADRLSSYGGGTSMMPTLDQLAQEGTTFTSAWSPSPVTLPALAGMLTGRIPSGMGVVDDEGSMLAGDAPRIATRLLDGGWATGMFVNAPFLDETSGIHEGFRRVYNPTSGGYTRARGASELFNEALEFLDLHRKVPAFVWVHVYDTHYPYLGAGVSGDGTQRYDAALHAADVELAVFMSALAERDLRSDAVLVLGSDHGEGLGEGGEGTHGLTLASATLKIPLVVSGAGIKAGQSIDSPVSLLDVAPTLADLTQLAPMEENGTLQGHSLAGLLDGEPGTPDRPVYAETFAPFFSYHWPPLRQILIAGDIQPAHAGQAGVPSQPDLGSQAVQAPSSQEISAVMVASRAIALAIATGDFAAAEEGLVQMPAAGKETPMWGRMMAAVRRSQGRPDEALADLRQAATTAGTCTDLWQTLASLEHELGRSSAATWQQVADLAGDRIRFRLKLAENLLREGQQAEAMTAARAAAAGRPESATLEAALGRIFLSAGHPREAQQLLAAAAVRSPGSASTYESLAQAALVTGETQGALDLLTEALRIDPSKRSLEQAIGNIHAMEDRMDEARAAWRRSLSPDLPEPGASLSIAEAFLRLGRFDETAAEVDKVRVQYPDDPQAHYIMGQVALARGNPDLATEELLASLSTGGEQATIYFYLAKASLMQDDENSALQYLERVFAADDPTLRRALQAERLMAQADRYPQVSSAVERYLAGASHAEPPRTTATGSDAP